MGKTYIHSLTPLRGIAALLVVIYHYQIFVSPLINPERSDLVNKWYIMVDFFFVLSGFIITHVYQNHFKDGFKWSVFKKFMIARFARLYPLHLVTLLFMIAIYLVMRTTGVFEQLPVGLKMTFDTNAIPSNIFLVQALGIHPEPTWNAPSWSICVEWWTYIFFPFLIYFLTHFKSMARWVVTAAAIGGYLAIMYYFQPMQFEARQEYIHGISEMPNTIDVMIGSGLLRCLSGFALGMIVYLAYIRNVGATILSNSGLMFLTWAGLFVGWHFNVIPDIVSAVVFGLLILMASYNNGYGKRILNRKYLQFLGDVSYSIYMVHMPIIYSFLTAVLVRKSWIASKLPSGEVVTDAVQTTINNTPKPYLYAWGGLVVYLTITLVAAYITYNYVEKPARIYLKNKLSKKKVPDPNQVALEKPLTSK